MIIEATSQKEPFQQLRQKFPPLHEIVSSLHREPAFSLVLYGGAVLDLLLQRGISNDLDFLLAYTGVLTQEQSNQVFLKSLNEVANRINANIELYENDHVVIHGLQNCPSIDIHFPSPDITLGLARSECTINGIGFNFRNEEFFDPLKGIPDFNRKLITVHSPAYVISGPSAFPRLYRTAAKLDVQLPESVRELVKSYHRMAAMTDGRTNIRVLYETLKIFSLPNGFSYIEDMANDDLIRSMFPELNPLYNAIVNAHAPHSMAINMQLIKNSFLYTPCNEEEKLFLSRRFQKVSQITQWGVLRFFLLFVGLGSCYRSLQINSPYEHAMSNGNPKVFIQRIEKNILGFMLARFRDHVDALRLLESLPFTVRAIAAMILPTEYPTPAPLKIKEPANLELIQLKIMKQWIS